jgi:hypothetical protein
VVLVVVVCVVVFVVVGWDGLEKVWTAVAEP